MAQHLPEIAETEHIRASLGYAHYFVSDTERHRQRTREEYDMLNVILGGCYRMETSGRELVARAGDVVFAPYMQLRVEENVPPEPLRCVAVFFRWENPPEHLPLVCRDELGRIRMMADWLHQQRGLWSPVQRNIAETYLLAMLGEYVRLSLAVVEHRWLRQFRTYVHDHIRVRITLDDLAAHLHVSKYHLVRKFKDLAGETPMSAVRRVRMEFARELAMSTPKTLAQIAEDVGIANPYHLSRLLKETFGAGIRELRRGMPAGRSARRG